MSEGGRDPPDGGYGWVIVGCFIIINSCLLPLTQCFGLIYTNEFKEMGKSAAEISFLLHLNNAVMCSLGIISGPLLKRFDFRQVSFLGAFLMCLGTFLTTFAKSYSALIFTISFLIGAGQGILLPGMYIAVNTYFKKRLTLAISFQVTGACLSNIFMPQVCYFLLREFGVRGTVLILSGISFNALPFVLLLHPLPKPKPQVIRKDITASTEHVSERLLSPVYRQTTVPAKTKQSWCEGIIRIMDLELFGDRVYVIIIVGMGISFAAELNVVLMLPFILSELAHFDDREVASAISVQSMADIVGRLVIPAIGHRADVHPKLMYILALLISSSGRTILAIFYENTAAVFGVCAIIGLAKGIKAVYQSVIIPKYVSSEKLAAATGLSMLTNGALSLLIGPLIGLPHDITDSYIPTLYTATILSLSCAVLWTVDYLCCKTKNEMNKEVLTITS